MITVLNGQRHGFLGRDKVYVGPTSKGYLLAASVLANPYAIGRDGKHSAVIAAYKRWLWEEYQKQGKVYDEIIRIAQMVASGRNIMLTCFPSPYPCSAHIIIALVNWVIKEHPELLEAERTSLQFA